LAELASKIHVSAPPEIDRLYPKLRPARVTVRTSRGTFTRAADEALGSRLVPLDDDGLKGKFYGLVGPVLGEGQARDIAERVWSIEEIDDVAPLVEMLAKRV
jgi:2-methylcitrate dehydratase PrpD